MFFPLGLGLKLRNIPWVTYLIVLACTINYFQFQNFSTVEKEISTVMSEERLNVSTEQLYYEYCVSKAKAPDSFCVKPVQAEDTAKQGKEKKRKPLPRVSISEILDDANIVVDFRKDLRNKDISVTQLDAYQDYAAKMKPYEDKIRNLHKKHNLLSDENLNLVAVLYAMFSHGGIMHLLGNMFALFVFGRYVESTVGSLFYALSYLVLGGLGLWMYAYLDITHNFVVGASANVFVIMGMFYVLFFHFKMKMYFWYFFIVSRKVTLNVKYYFPIFFLVQEVVLSLAGAETNVAHKAHFYGLIFGLIIAYIWKKQNEMPRDFLYKDEFEFWNEIKNIPDTKSFLDEANKILKYNPYNNEVKNKMLERLLATQQYSDNDIVTYRYLDQLLPYYLIDNINQKENFPIIYSILSLVPGHVSYYKYFYLVNQKQILLLLDDSIDNNQLIHAIKLIQLFFEKYQRSRKLKNMEKTLFSIFDYLKNKEEFEYHINIMEQHSISRKFKASINRYRTKLGAVYGDS